MLFLNVFTKILFPKHLNAAGERTLIEIFELGSGTLLSFHSFDQDADFHLLLQPVPWKMRLRMLVGILIEILNGGEI